MTNSETQREPKYMFAEGSGPCRGCGESGSRTMKHFQHDIGIVCWRCAEAYKWHHGLVLGPGFSTDTVSKLTRECGCDMASEAGSLADAVESYNAIVVPQFSEEFYMIGEEKASFVEEARGLCEKGSEKTKNSLNCLTEYRRLRLFCSCDEKRGFLCSDSFWKEMQRSRMVAIELIRSLSQTEQANVLTAAGCKIRLLNSAGVNN